jgi:parallel beta-helix repeat protein
MTLFTISGPQVSVSRFSNGTQPTLQADGCARNAQAGIGYSDTAGGVARGNDCSGNKWGIYVAETADPGLKDNDCRHNASEDVLDLRPSGAGPVRLLTVGLAVQVSPLPAAHHEQTNRGQPNGTYCKSPHPNSTAHLSALV